MLTYDCLAADTVYIHVDRSSGCGGYRLQSSIVSPEQANDAEPNNSIAEAASLAPNTQQEGHMGYFNTPIPVDGDDFYAFNPQDTGALTFRAITHNSLSSRLMLYNAAGGLITFTGFVTADTLEIAYNAPNSDTLYILLDRSSGCGGYTIEVDNGCPQPTNVTEQLIISIGVQIDWDDMPLATGGYNIGGRRAGTTEFLSGFGIPNSNFRRFPLQSCTEYEYRVESVCATRSSGYIPVKSFTTLCAPFCPALTGVGVSGITATSATVSWTGSIVNTASQIQYTPVGGSTQSEVVPMGQTFVNLTGLLPSTTYDYDLRQSCFDNGLSPFVSGSFTTATLREDGTLNSAILFPNPATDQFDGPGLAGSRSRRSGQRYGPSGPAVEPPGRYQQHRCLGLGPWPLCPSPGRRKNTIHDAFYHRALKAGPKARTLNACVCSLQARPSEGAAPIGAAPFFVPYGWRRNGAL